MPRKVKGRSRLKIQFGKALEIIQLTELTTELQLLRDHPPLVQRRDGKYEGGLLGFVRGLRLSARLIYFLRDLLSASDLEVSWGHMLDDKEMSVSRECDVIIHEKGHKGRWNGRQESIMDFRFVRADRVRAVISCKSMLSSIDRNYTKSLRKYGVKKVLLFAECCDQRQFPRLRQLAIKSGYRGLWCLYLIGKGSSRMETDEGMLLAFGRAVRKAVGAR